MKGLAELTAENDAIVRRAEKRRDDSIKRLKQRIARVTRGWRGWIATPALQREIAKAIDAWRKAEGRK